MYATYSFFAGLGLSSPSELEPSDEEIMAFDLTFCCCFIDNLSSLGAFSFFGFGAFGSRGFLCL